MNKKIIINGLGLCIAVSLTACGMTPEKPTVQKTVTTYQAKKVVPVVAARVVTKPKKQIVRKVITKPVKRKSYNTISRNQYVAKFEAEQRRKKYAAVHRARKAKADALRAKQHRAVKQGYINRFNAQQARNKVNSAHKYRVTSGQGSYASLRGDYARNPQTIAFINKMVSKHGFDRGHLNYLFSNTNQTPFLKRMAYADGHPKRKFGKKPRPGRWSRYRGNFLTPRTINKGVAFARANRVALQRAEDRYGVPKEYILGIIGVETRYGGNVGKNRAIDALAAMGFDNARRGKYFQKELEAYLLMTRKERLDPLKPMASYAGALGLCQFMPSNIKRYAVDHDNSGTVNLWTPADAIGSVANYFQKHGWKNGGTVTVPAKYSSSGYRTLRTGFKSKHSISRLKNMGISANNLGNISGKASLIKLNSYSGDELWLGGHNFYVITRYNHSSRYAMAVHQLAQAIKGRIGGGRGIRQASLVSPMKVVN